MKRVGMTWQVDPAHWDEYREVHLNPWPELLAAIQAAGIHNYNIFAFGTRMFAFMEIEGDDPLEAFDKVARTEIKRKWDREVTIHVLPEAQEGSGIQFMEIPRVFFCP